MVQIKQKKEGGGGSKKRATLSCSNRYRFYSINHCQK